MSGFDMSAGARGNNWREENIFADGREMTRPSRDERMQWLAETLDQLLSAGDPDAIVRELFPRMAAHLDVDANFDFMADASEHRYHSLLQSLPAAIYTTDAKGCITFYNEAAATLWGRKPALGRDYWCGSWRIYRLDGTELPLDQCPMARALKEGQAITGEEIVVERPDGVRRTILPHPCPIFNRSGAMVGATNMLVDITDRKSGEVALREAKEAAEAANRAKDRFLAVLSHELRTPLSPVLMTVSALEADPELRPDVREDLAMIRRNVELETKLIDDLLDLSRIVSGKLTLRPLVVDLNEAVHQVCSICRSQVLEKGIHLHYDLNGEVGYVNADPARLQQILWNVLKNAVKFTPDNGDIFVATTRTESGRVQVRVHDTGIGMEPQTMERIFYAFEQGDEKITSQFGGLGLGLAISKALIELHGGAIWAKSAGLGKGCTFTIELPADTSGGEVPRSPSIFLQEQGPERPLRLLVVEDHADTARTLGRLLVAWGYSVKSAASVASALEIASLERFDVLISDIGLPDATGYQLMQQLRELHSIKGIAMSGYGMDEDMRKSREAGFAEHLVKPVDVLQLQQALRRVSAAT